MLKISRKKQIITMAILGISIAGVYFLFQYKNNTRTLEKVTIANPGGIPSSFIWIGEANGYFKDEGLDVTFKHVDSGRAALNSLREGTADITASGDFPLTISILEGDKIFIIAEMDSDEGSNIIGRSDLGISIPADFKGKKVGVTKGTANEFQLYSFLSAHGLSERDVTLIDMKFADTKDALVSGKVDAVTARQSDIVQLKKELGSNGVIFNTRDIYTFRFFLLGNQDFIKEHPEVAKKVLRALIKAEEFTSNHPAEARDIVSKSTKLDPGILEEAWRQHRFSINLSQPIVLILEDQTRWIKDNNLITVARIPNFLTYIYFDAMQDVRPESITITH